METAAALLTAFFRARLAQATPALILHGPGATLCSHRLDWRSHATMRCTQLLTASAELMLKHNVHIQGRTCLTLALAGVTCIACYRLYRLSGRSSQAFDAQDEQRAMVLLQTPMLSLADIDQQLVHNTRQENELKVARSDIIGLEQLQVLEQLKRLEDGEVLCSALELNFWQAKDGILLAGPDDTGKSMLVEVCQTGSMRVVVLRKLLA
jgi:hypothetical protein